MLLVMMKLRPCLLNLFKLMHQFNNETLKNRFGLAEETIIAVFNPSTSFVFVNVAHIPVPCACPLKLLFQELHHLPHLMRASENSETFLLFNDVYDMPTTENLYPSLKAKPSSTEK